MDDKPETFSAGFPMSQMPSTPAGMTAMFQGRSPFPTVEFMPGAFAYHLHSFSAHTLRSTSQYWCGPLLAAGATATMGCIDEPYLTHPRHGGIFQPVVGGFTYGKAACAAQHAVSWQTTVVGDPLYRPFAADPRAQHEQLVARHSPWVEWSDLRLVDINLASGAAPDKSIRFLETDPNTRQSAVLTEKLANLYQAAGNREPAIKAFRQALALHPTPQTSSRLTLALGDQLVASGQEAEALKVYDAFQKNAPAYPDALALWQKMQTLAVKIGKKSQAARYSEEIQKLSPKPNP